MKKNQKKWVIAAIVFQLLTAAIHSISYFVKPTAANETEKQFLDLFNNYRTDMGAGFSPSTAELFMSFSISFTLIFVFGGLINIALIKTRASQNVLKAIFGIETIIYGGVFVATAALTFLPPIICTALIFSSCLGAYFSIRKNAPAYT